MVCVGFCLSTDIFKSSLSEPKATCCFMKHPYRLLLHGTVVFFSRRPHWWIFCSAQVKGPFPKFDYTPNVKKEIGMIAGGTGKIFFCVFVDLFDFVLFGLVVYKKLGSGKSYYLCLAVFLQELGSEWYTCGGA